MVLYRCRETFLKALTFQADLKRQEFSNWFLVTSIEQQKLTEATKLNFLAEKFLHQDNFLIINKCLNDEIKTWKPTNPELIKFQKITLEKEKLIDSYSNNNFKNIIKFKEVLESKPTAHVKSLAQQFENISSPENVI